MIEFSKKKKTVVLTCNKIRLKALFLVSSVWLCIRTILISKLDLEKSRKF